MVQLSRMRETLLLLLLSGAAQAAIQNVSAVEFTATQAILKYQAPDGAPCTIEVSENPNFLPVVNDVNPVKFASAASDGRAGNVQAGNERSFVIGKRAAEVGLDGARYSRALQANTRHYFRITCAGAGNVATGSFKTMNIQFGNNYLEAEPGDRKRPGEMAQPHISLSNRSDEVIDPLTGLLLKRLSAGNDTIQPINGAPWMVARSSRWQGVGNVFAQDGQSATVSASTAPLFLGLKTGVGGAPYTGGMTSWAQPYAGILMLSYGYYQAHLVASINPGGTAPANPEDAKVVACRTIDGVNCDATSDTYETVLRTSNSDVAFGTMNAGDLWQKAGNGAPNWTQEGTRAGSVTCTGTPTVNRTGGEFFGSHWGTGSTININGTDYSVASLVNSSQLILTSNCATSNSASVPYTATNFGILIRKKTASSDQVSIDYGYVNYELDFFNNFTVGTSNLCGLQTVPGPTGRPGFNCYVPNGNLYWVDAENGDANVWGNFNNVVPGGGICAFDTGHVFDLMDPDKFYCGNSGPIYALKYYGNHAKPASGLFLYSGLNWCNTNAPNTPPYLNQQPCMVTTLVTPGTSLPALTAAFTSNPAYAPAFDPAKFPAPFGLEVEPGGSIVIDYTQSGQFTLGWVIVYNPNATSNSEGGTITGSLGNHGCLGGGHPGCVIAAMPSWTRPGCRWCVIKHGVAALEGWESTEVFGWNGKVGGGPYQVQVINGTANGTGNVLDRGTSLGTCPPSAFDTPGVRCTKLTVSSEPFGPADALHTGLPGEMGDARVGDYFSTEVQLPINYLEQMRLIVKEPGAAPGTWVFTFQREINHPAGLNYAITGPNPVLYTLCNSMQNPGRIYAAATWMWNWGADPHGMNQDGTTIPSDNSNFNGHQFWSNGAWAAVEIPAVDPRCAGMQCYATRVPGGRPFLDVVTQTAPTAMIKSAPRFAGGAGLDESNLQSHVTSGGEIASPDRFAYLFDGRPYRGGYSSGSPDGVSGSHPATLIAGQLYKFAIADLVNLELPFRKIYPTAAFSGRYPLIDVSSPVQGDQLGTGSEDSFKYCVVAIAGECRASSAVGDIYVNAPHVTYPFCFNSAQNNNLADEQDICISGSPSNRDGIVQVGMNDSDLTGVNQRVLTKFVAARVLSPFWTPYVLPNGKWMIFESQFSGDGTANKALMLGKIPPPDEQDKLDRTTFVPITLRIPARPGSSAFVRFGYAENGDPGTFFCTSRQENCVTAKPGDQAVDVVNPFYFEQAEAQSYQAVDCSNGCSITIPGIPQRVVYYQVVFNQAGDVTQTPVLTTVVP